MEIDSALQELHQLHNLTSNSLDCVDEKVKKKCPSDSIKVPNPFESSSSSTMELDSALHKLGMLSSVTGSRINYLEEKAKKKRSSNSLSSAPLCVVQMNPNFIKKFSLSKKSSASAESESDDESYPQASLRREVFTCHPARLRRKMRLSQNTPYFKQARLKSNTIPVGTVFVLPPETASPPSSVSRQDSGNKSNPSSPVKSQSSLTSQGSSITRSRSLDDLEIIDCPPDCCCPYTAVRTDIDTVSQSISQLHVS